MSCVETSKAECAAFLNRIPDKSLDGRTPMVVPRVRHYFNHFVPLACLLATCTPSQEKIKYLRRIFFLDGRLHPCKITRSHTGRLFFEHRKNVEGEFCEPVASQWVVLSEKIGDSGGNDATLPELGIRKKCASCHAFRFIRNSSQGKGILRGSRAVNNVHSYQE